MPKAKKAFLPLALIVIAAILFTGCTDDTQAKSSSVPTSSVSTVDNLWIDDDTSSLPDKISSVLPESEPISSEVSSLPPKSKPTHNKASSAPPPSSSKPAPKSKAKTSSAYVPENSPVENGEQKVYWGESGTKYHRDKACRSFKGNTPQSGTIEDAVSAGRTGWCGICSK